MATSQPIPVYLSASVANAALNEKLRAQLPADRVELILPQDFTPQIPHKTLERAIYERCIEAMERSAVGLLLLDSFGIDCAMESGWYAANRKPLVAIGNASTRFVNNWMVKGAITHFVTLEEPVYEVAKADPILKGYSEVELLTGWTELAAVLERAAGGAVMGVLSKAWHLNRMGRIEGPPLAGALVLAGAALGAGVIETPAMLAAGAMTAITMNYVYLVNGVTDVEEDRVNSPDRPLVRGDVSLREANLYVNVLLALGVLYPLVIHPTWSERLIVWTILLMGVLYSVPPIRLKRWPPVATIYLVANFNLPIVLGHQVSGAPGVVPPYLFATVALFLANMPLKDVGDDAGDAEAGIANWANWLGRRRLLTLSVALSIAGALASAIVLAPLGDPWRWIFSGLVLLPAINVGVHVALRWDLDRMFTRGVRALIVLAIIAALYGSPPALWV